MSSVPCGCCGGRDSYEPSAGVCIWCGGTGWRHVIPAPKTPDQIAEEEVEALAEALAVDEWWARQDRLHAYRIETQDCYGLEP